MRLIKERMPSGLLALLGVALTIPTIFLPTARLTVSRERNGEVRILQDTKTWSFGKSSIGVPPTGEDVRENLVNNWPGLAVLVIFLIIGLAGAYVWLTRPGVGAAVLGAVGLALVAGRVITVTATRMGYVETGSSTSSFTVERPLMIAGLLESVGAACLLAALVLLALGISSTARAAARVTAGASGGANAPSAPTVASAAVTSAVPSQAVSSEAVRSEPPQVPGGFAYPTQPAQQAQPAMPGSPTAHPGPAASGQAPAPDFAPKPPQAPEGGN